MIIFSPPASSRSSKPFQTSSITIRFSYRRSDTQLRRRIFCFREQEQGVGSVSGLPSTSGVIWKSPSSMTYHVPSWPAISMLLLIQLSIRHRSGSRNCPRALSESLLMREVFKSLNRSQVSQMAVDAAAGRVARDTLCVHRHLPTAWTREASALLLLGNSATRIRASVSSFGSILSTSHAPRPSALASFSCLLPRILIANTAAVIRWPLSRLR